MKPVIIIAIAFVLLFPIGIAYGNIEGATGKYFCDPTRLNIEERDYTRAVENINKSEEAYKLRNPDATMDERNLHLVKQIEGHELNTKVKCLAETHGVGPDTVAQFSPEAKETLGYNLEALYMVAPDLVENADVPEFGSLIMLVSIVGLVGAVFFSKHFKIFRF